MEKKMLVFKEIKQESKDALVGNRLMFLLAILLIGAFVGFTFGFGSLIAPALSAGLFFIGRGLLRGEEFDFNLIFKPFKDLNHAIRIIGASFLVGLIVFLGTLLFIIPGIIFAHQYAMVVFIIAEDKDVKVMEALQRSKEMMHGHKLDLFVFRLSFIGHFLLGIITLGIYMFYFAPYYQVANINFYVHLRGEIKEGIEEVDADDYSWDPEEY